MSDNVLHDAKEALEGLNTGKIVEIYADEFLFEDSSANARITDRKVLKVYFQRLFTQPQVSFSDIRILEADRFAIIEWTWGGINRNSGEPFRVRGASVIELSGGKVSRKSIYYDPRLALS